jgi:hypothetical protein
LIQLSISQSSSGRHSSSRSVAVDPNRRPLSATRAQPAEAKGEDAHALLAQVESLAAKQPVLIDVGGRSLE